MLILSLAAVAREPVAVRGVIAVDDPVWEGSEIEFVEPVRVDAEARSVGEGVLVRGQIAARIRTACRRCLTPVEVDVRDTIELLYEPLAGEDEDELEGEVFALPDRGDQLDLAPAIREQVVLRIPDYVVCSESCRGLCPQCGIDRNTQACACVPERGNGAWDALKKIKFD
jgi:uncharacterized protein